MKKEDSQIDSSKAKIKNKESLKKLFKKEKSSSGDAFLASLPETKPKEEKIEVVTKKPEIKKTRNQRHF